MAGKHKQHTHEEKIEKGKRICDLYAANNFTIASCCESEGITDLTFRIWCNEINEINDAYKAAKTQSEVAYKTRLRQKTLTALERGVEGWEYKKTTKEIKKIDGKEYTRITETIEQVLPNPTLIIFSATNTNNINDPDFLHQNRTEHTGKNGGEIQIRQLPEWMQETAGLKKEEEVKND